MHPTQNQQPSYLMSQRQYQRFSWQAPVAGDAPAYDERQQQFHQPVSQQPQISTQGMPQRQYSYTQTPNELRAFVYTSSPNDPPLPQANRTSMSTTACTPIDSRPQSMLGPQYPTIPPQSQVPYLPPSYEQDEKHPISPISPDSGTRSVSFSPVSPMPEQLPIQRPTEAANRHSRQMSHLVPINTKVTKYPLPPIPATPLAGTPCKTPTSAGSMSKSQLRNGPISPTNRVSNVYEPYEPYSALSSKSNKQAPFSPDSVLGPIGSDFSRHQPGQISHPNMDSEISPKWKNSFFGCSDDVSTCLTGLFCPCILYGRTSHRLSKKSAKQDPTDMLGYSAANGHCMVMSAACGLWWLFPMLQRTRIRHTYKLEGSVADDCLKGVCCCFCGCVAIQNEREVKSREELSRRWAGPAAQATTQAYSRASGMVYKPQQ